MRDHPHHTYKIQGGMFGVKKNKNIVWKELMDQFVQCGNRMYDQDFLSQKIYPLYQNSMIIHASFNRYENECLDFPISYESDDYRFVGEYVYENESRNKQNIDQIKNGINHINHISDNDTVKPQPAIPFPRRNHKIDNKDK